MRIRPSDNAHATLDRLTNGASDLEEVTTRGKSLLSTLDLPQKPDGPDLKEAKALLDDLLE